MRILGRPIDPSSGPSPADAPTGAGGLSAILAKAPAPLLLALSGLIVGVVGWDALLHPLPVLLAVAGWGAYVQRARLAAFARALAAPRAVPLMVERAVAAVVPADVAPSGTIIMADLRLDGRLYAASEVEVFGRLSGEVNCDVIRLHAGAELRGRVACRQIGVVEDALFEGIASSRSDRA